jgi:hypothetical protein
MKAVHVISWISSELAKGDDQKALASLIALRPSDEVLHAAAEVAKAINERVLARFSDLAVEGAADDSVRRFQLDSAARSEERLVLILGLIAGAQATLNATASGHDYTP